MDEKAILVSYFPSRKDGGWGTKEYIRFSGNYPEKMFKLWLEASNANVSQMKHVDCKCPASGPGMLDANGFKCYVHGTNWRSTLTG